MKEKNAAEIHFYTQKGEAYQSLSSLQKHLFTGELLSAYWDISKGEPVLMIGLGEEALEAIQIKEVAAKAAKECQAKKIGNSVLFVDEILTFCGKEHLIDVLEGLYLGGYQEPKFTKEKEDISEPSFEIKSTLFTEEELSLAKEKTSVLCASIKKARDRVNAPANRLTPEIFAREVQEEFKNLNVEVTVFTKEDLIKMQMDALLTVGDSAQNPPFLVILTYKGDEAKEESIGLVGKGVTVDTGGYCLKTPGSMKGIRGDMAGGAAVIGALHALAKNKVKTNVIAAIPMCENRISSGSFLTGDVISSYSGKTIEIGNTDAEGRLILADAVSYLTENKKVSQILDIATLTGAVVNLLGFTIGGLICDNEQFYQEFMEAANKSGERYLRIPFYKEHEKMIDSQVADVKNISEQGCGTITAGLFIRRFAGKTPWLHLDIAGTAWTDPAVFEFQAKGATGAAISTLYYLAGGEII